MIKCKQAIFTIREVRELLEKSIGIKADEIEFFTKQGEAPVVTVCLSYDMEDDDK